MRTKMIVYQLDDSSEDYKLISSGIKLYSNWIKVMNRIWMIKTSKRSSTIRDELRDIIEGRGEILVIDITSSGWGTYNVSKKVTKWMKENMQ